MSVAERLARVRESVAAAARRAGRDPREICLVAVSKTHTAGEIRQAHEAGQRVFGENYVQEMLAKQHELEDLDDIAWHLIGHLQRNKVRQVVGRVVVVETVDSQRLLLELDKRGAEAGRLVDVLLQVDVASEETKSGCRPDELGGLLEAARSCKSLRVRGLMAIPPFEAEPEESRKHFRALRELRARHGGSEALPVLSMGMSSDFEVAIEEGATIVRVGTAIFGVRSAASAEPASPPVPRGDE